MSSSVRAPSILSSLSPPFIEGRSPLMSVLVPTDTHSDDDDDDELTDWWVEPTWPDTPTFTSISVAKKQE